jgi:hypothetical protein
MYSAVGIFSNVLYVRYETEAKSVHERKTHPVVREDVT